MYIWYIINSNKKLLAFVLASHDKVSVLSNNNNNFFFSSNQCHTLWIASLGSPVGNYSRKPDKIIHFGGCTFLRNADFIMIIQILDYLLLLLLLLLLLGIIILDKKIGGVVQV